MINDRDKNRSTRPRHAVAPARRHKAPLECTTVRYVPRTSTPPQRATLSPPSESTMRVYHDYLRHILDHGVEKQDRTGTGTRSVFGYQMRFNLQDGFPLVTTKKLHIRSIIHELLWFLNGDTNIRYLKENGVSIWDEWADEDGDLGPVYGKQWRRWETPDGRVIDQVQTIVETIRTNPDSRRMIVGTWYAVQLVEQSVPPRHLLFQFCVSGGKLPFPRSQPRVGRLPR